MVAVLLQQFGDWGTSLSIFTMLFSIQEYTRVYKSIQEYTRVYKSIQYIKTFGRALLPAIGFQPGYLVHKQLAFVMFISLYCTLWIQ